jgi:SAM-dependent methyltransferase
MARVYDAIMQDIDYEDWTAFILDTLSERGWQGRSVLDLGCGTGNSTFPFFAKGYHTLGLDASAEMLEVARQKLPPVTFIEADFTTFDLAERFDLVVSVFDSMNNLLDEQDFVRTARRVLEHLTLGGFFVFDVNTTVGLRDLWESGRAEGWAGDVYYCWEHTFDEQARLARVEAHCSDGRASFMEVHVERPYDPAELHALLREAGFEDIEVLDYPSGCPAPEDAGRVWAVARKT